ncbi:MAG: HAD family hydrolase [Anaerolineae bacterium]|nr:HAD family hydrolase [Anaerolineae bacterium]
MDYRAVVFDFDYTLVDSSEGILDCISYALDQLGLPAVSAERACRTIGLSLPEIFVELAGTEQAARSDEFGRLFVDRADRVMNEMTRLYPEARAAIEELLECGLRLGIVSTKYRYRIERFLESEGLRTAFAVVVGREDVPVPKPDPYGLVDAIARLGVVRQQALYVGDSVVDAETASRAGVDFVAVLSGATEAGEFGPYAPVAVLPSLAELPELLGCPG